MRILIDIGHPAHVHYFRNMARILTKKGHIVLFTVRKKEIAIDLLDLYKLPYVVVGETKEGLFSKVGNIVQVEREILKCAKKFRPDIFVGFGSFYAAHVAFLLGKRCFIFEDSESSFFTNSLYRPFADHILTPDSFRSNYGKKQTRFKGYIELAYLHPAYFKPNPKVLEALNLRKGEKFFVLRFVGWKASHDIGKSGYNLEQKRKLIRFLGRYGKILITSERPLLKEFDKYRIKVPYNKIHDLLYFATMFISDSQTMTTESALLGTPAIRYNSFAGPKDMGNFVELEKKYDLIYSFDNFEKSLSKIRQLVSQRDIKSEWARKRQLLLNEKIDVTNWMVNFIEGEST